MSGGFTRRNRGVLPYHPHRPRCSATSRDRLARVGRLNRNGVRVFIQASSLPPRLSASSSRRAPQSSHSQRDGRRGAPLHWLPRVRPLSGPRPRCPPRSQVEGPPRSARTRRLVLRAGDPAQRTHGLVEPDLGRLLIAEPGDGPAQRHASNVLSHSSTVSKNSSQPFAQSQPETVTHWKPFQA